MPRSKITPSLEQLYKLTKQQGECRIWQGACNPSGQPKINKEIWGCSYARQWAFSTTGQQIQQHTPLRNTCKNPLCVNPLHLTYQQDRSTLLAEFMTSVNTKGGFPEGKEYLGECHLWTKKPAGDGRGRFSKAKWGETIPARWIYKLSKNKPDLSSTITVNHWCNNPLCVNPNHLYTGEESETWNRSNIQQAIQEGRIHNQVVKPTQEQEVKERVAEIRRRILAGARTKDLCAEFKCSKPTIADIKYNRSYPDSSYTPPEKK